VAVAECVAKAEAKVQVADANWVPWQSIIHHGVRAGRQAALVRTSPLKMAIVRMKCLQASLQSLEPSFLRRAVTVINQLTHSLHCNAVACVQGPAVNR
jgi:hypothetical protein